MAFRVNTNMMAANALRNLSTTNAEFGNSVTRLSTGLRINSAADDPAGLISSENFRGQIAGIDQAIRNNQDATNYAKTAEGALDEVSRLLRDAKSLAVASNNSAALTDSQKAANQSQLNSIVASIDRIAGQTAFGSRKLLDGSAGTYATSTNGSNIAGMSFSGSFSGSAVTTNSTITVQVTSSGTKASVTGTRTFALATTTMTNAGSFTLNGVSFSVSQTDTIQDVVARINNKSDTTNVTASWSAAAGVTLTNKSYGSDNRVDLVDSNAILLSAAGTSSSVGTDAVANVVIDSNGATAGGLVTVSFASGKGLNLKDTYGNSITLTENGNLNLAAIAGGQLVAGSSQFQIGADAGQTASLSLGNFASTELGKNIVSGKTLNNLDLSTAQGASDALSVINKAIDDIGTARGNIGSFQRNILESNVRSLGVARENLAATESTIRDIDVAQEMTTFTKLQILQQSGLSVLAQANSAPQAVLSLLR